MHAPRLASTRSLALAAALVVVFMGTATARAQAPASSGPRPSPEQPKEPFGRFHRGAKEVGLIAGYGFGLDFGAAQSGDVRLFVLLPHWGIQLTRTYGLGHWYAGGLSLLIEGVYLHSFDPHRGGGGGGQLIFRDHFFALGRFVPFVELGGGMLGVDFDLSFQQRDGFEFALTAGGGAQIFLARSVALTLEWRIHHISNAGIHQPNDGINTHHILGGLSIFLG